MVHQRRKLLDYLKGKDMNRYQALIGSLSLREMTPMARRPAADRR